MQEVLGYVRGWCMAGLSTVLRSRTVGLTVKAEYEQKILAVLKKAQQTPVPSQDVQAQQNSTPPKTGIAIEGDAVQESGPVMTGSVQEGSVMGGSRKEYSTDASPPIDLGFESAESRTDSTEQDLPFRSLGSSSRERRVPATPFGRVLGFAGLGANLAYGAVQDSVQSFFRSETPNTTRMMNERNAEVLAAGLCRMRGAALKLGQMLSIQDEAMIPPYLQAALDRVRAGADYMPRHQLERVLRNELGAEWRKKFDEFDFMPMAAASIGQVHRAVLLDGTIVAMKIQYPGVATSIESDLKNLMTLMKMTDVLPKGLYVDTIVKVMRKELALECDYAYEMQSQQLFKKRIEGDPYCRVRFQVPDVFPELSTKQILTSEWATGVPIDRVKELSQEVRNEVGNRLLYITMKELFTWRYMQTDPNWGNFLYDPETEILSLIDFGAAKEFPKSFTDEYLRMVAACAEQNRDGAIDASKKLGFLTGDENQAMLDAHCEAGFIVGRPFSKPEDYDFSQHSKLTARVTELGRVMLKHRLCPPPEESYSLHRKLSGAFLCCIKLGSIIPSHRMFYNVLNNHSFDS